MYKKIAAACAVLLSVQSASANLQSKDWEYKRIFSGGNDYCTSSTYSSSDAGIEAQLTFTVPVSSSEMPKIEIVLESPDLEGLQLKGAIAQSNASDFSQNFYGLETVAVDERQTLFLPIWNGEQIIDDLISDSRYVAQLVDSQGREDDQITFSLRGSSKVIRTMAKECLGLDSIAKPRTLSKFLSETQLLFVDSIEADEDDLPSASTLSMDEYYTTSLELSEKSITTYADGQDYFVAIQDRDVAVEDLQNLQSDKVSKERNRRDLSAEKTQIADDKVALPKERRQVARDVRQDESDIADLRQQRDDAAQELASAKRNATTSRDRMAELETIVETFDRKLKRTERDLVNKEQLLTDNRNESRRVERRIRQLRDGNDIDRKQRMLDRKRSELRQARQELNDYGADDKIRRELRNNSTYQQNKKEVDRLARDESNAQSGLNQANRDLRAEENRKSSLQQQIRSDQQTLNTLDSDIQALERQKRQNLDRNAQLNEQRKSAQNQKSQKEAQYDRECGGGGGDPASCRALRSQVVALGNKINQIDSQVNQVIRKRQQIEQSVQNKQAQKQSLPGKIERNRRELSGIDGRISDLKRRQQDLSRSLNDISQRKVRIQREQRSIEQTVRQNVNRRKNVLERRVSELRREVQILENEISGVSAEIQQLERRQVKLDRESRELENELPALRDRKVDLERRLRTARDKRDRYAQSPDFKNAQDRLNRAERASERARNAYQATRTRLAENQARVVEIDRLLASYDSRLVTINREVQRLGTEISRLGAEVKSQKVVVSDLEEEADKLGQDYTDQVLAILSNEKRLFDNMVEL